MPRPAGTTRAPTTWAARRRTVPTTTLTSATSTARSRACGTSAACGRTEHASFIASIAAPARLHLDDDAGVPGDLPAVRHLHGQLQHDQHQGGVEPAIPHGSPLGGAAGRGGG